MTFNQKHMFVSGFVVLGLIACGSKVDKAKNNKMDSSQAKVSAKAKDVKRIALSGDAVLGVQNLEIPEIAAALKVAPGQYTLSATLSEENKTNLKSVASLKSKAVIGCSDAQLADLPVQSDLAAVDVKADANVLAVAANTIVVCGEQALKASRLSLRADKLILRDAKISMTVNAESESAYLGANQLVLVGQNSLTVREKDAKTAAKRIDLVVSEKIDQRTQDATLALNAGVSVAADAAPAEAPKADAKKDEAKDEKPATFDERFNAVNDGKKDEAKDEKAGDKKDPAAEITFPAP